MGNTGQEVRAAWARGKAEADRHERMNPWLPLWLAVAPALWNLLHHDREGAVIWFVYISLAYFWVDWIRAWDRS